MVVDVEVALGIFFFYSLKTRRDMNYIVVFSISFIFVPRMLGGGSMSVRLGGGSRRLVGIHGGRR